MLLNFLISGQNTVSYKSGTVGMQTYYYFSDETEKANQNSHYRTNWVIKKFFFARKENCSLQFLSWGEGKGGWDCMRFLKWTLAFSNNLSPLPLPPQKNIQRSILKEVNINGF